MSDPAVGIVLLVLISSALGGGLWKLVKAWKSKYDGDK